MDRLTELLRRALAMQGSDLHLVSGVPPLVRVDGALRSLEGYAPLDGTGIGAAIFPYLDDDQRARFEATSELDMALAVDGVTRVRCNVFRQRGTVGVVCRVVPDRVPRLGELGLPRIVSRLTSKSSGLVVVTGPTGSGKSTTLAAMVDAINESRPVHVLTIEDPIEFVHSHKCGVVNQREVHSDTAGFAPALRAAMREDPDVVLIGEIRDLETMAAALRVAETGHLTLTSLHTRSAVQTIDRIVDMFPAHQQPQVRSQVALALEGIVSQILVPRAVGPGRAVAAEVLVAIPAVRHLIREGKLHQLYSVMQSVQNEEVGMRTLNRGLAMLVSTGEVTKDVALQVSSDPDELRKLIARGLPSSCPRSSVVSPTTRRPAGGQN